MAASTPLDKAQQEFAEASMSFHIAYEALQTTLGKHLARDKATDHLLHYADCYGVDHTMSLLAKSPEVFDLQGPFSTSALSTVSKDLQAAYDASHQMDLALAAREQLAMKENPSHQKAIQIAGREYILDAAADRLIDRQSGRAERANLTYVTSDNGGKPRDKERDR